MKFTTMFTSPIQTCRAKYRYIKFRRAANRAERARRHRKQLELEAEKQKRFSLLFTVKEYARSLIS